jgi:hypothetical protein
MEDDVSRPTDDGDFLHDLEIEVEAELHLAESSRPEEVIELPVDEWPFDPTDVQREEIDLRSLLGAVKAIEDDAPRHDDRSGGS